MFPNKLASEIIRFNLGHRADTQPGSVLHLRSIRLPPPIYHPL